VGFRKTPPPLHLLLDLPVLLPRLLQQQLLLVLVLW
jgi:hypothetical protein